MLTIRLATAADLPAINAIYNHYVRTSTCTYQTEPSTDAERAEWFADRDARLPVTVAELDGRVAGWGSLNRFHARAAYRFTTENSVYVDHAMHRQGIGRALLVDLIARARVLEYHAILAVISADQAASLKLHEALGFVEVGCAREIGWKFDRWLDVAYLELLLHP
jgi:phosphinothricin acetyltransferase